MDHVAMILLVKGYRRASVQRDNMRVVIALEPEITLLNQKIIAGHCYNKAF